MGRSGLDWTAKYPATATALTKLPVQSAYLDGELCAVRPNGVSDFALMQQASDRDGAGLVDFLSDLLELNGEPLAAMPLAERKSRLAALLGSPPPASTLVSMRPATARRSAAPPAATASKASSPSASTGPTCQATAALDQNEMPQPR